MIAITGYLICAFLCYGMLFAHFQNEFASSRKYKYRDDLGYSLMMGLVVGMLGPIGVLFTLLMTGFAKYGFKVK